MSNSNESSRDIILQRIKAGKPQSTPLPDVPIYTYPGDKVDEFTKHVQAFDGKVIPFNSKQEAIEYLNTNLDKGKKIFSSVNEYQGNIQLTDFKTPHDANIIDICVSSGVLGVAETGSIWVTNNTFKLAATALFSTDLFLFLDKSTLVSGLHEAYQKNDLRSTQYGSFYTGPSATADIEAVHITGAQGEISLTVLLY
ncbi:MAG: LutC/YkgG family protein [Marinifilaceae bacterium]